MNKPHHRFLLTEWLMQIDALDEALPRLSNENAARLQEEESPSGHWLLRRSAPFQAIVDVRLKAFLLRSAWIWRTFPRQCMWFPDR